MRAAWTPSPHVPKYVLRHFLAEPIFVRTLAMKGTALLVWSKLFRDAVVGCQPAMLSATKSRKQRRCSYAPSHVAARRTVGGIVAMNPAAPCHKIHPRWILSSGTRTSVPCNVERSFGVGNTRARFYATVATAHLVLRPHSLT